MANSLTIEDIKIPIQVIFEQIVANLIKVGTKGRVLFLKQNADLTENFKVVSNPSAVKADAEETKLAATDLIPLVIGVVAGCPYTMSVSYKLFNELKSVKMPSEIKEGQFILYEEEEGIRVANPCNTLQTLTTNITEDMKSIAISEGMDRTEVDIVKAYRTGYKGKYKNSYDNQMLLISAIKFYLKELEKMGIFDPNYNNTVDIDTDTVKDMWKAIGKNEDEVDGWDEMTARNNTYKNMVFLLADVKYLDAMEGLKLRVKMF